MIEETAVKDELEVVKREVIAAHTTMQAVRVEMVKVGTALEAAVEQMAEVQAEMQVLERRLLTIESTQPHLVTTPDLAQALRTQSFILVVLLTGIMFALFILMR